MALVLSEIESEIFRCKVARFETDILNTYDFQQQLIEHSIDFCRLKVNSAHLENYEALVKLCVPHQFCGSILKYKMDFFNLPKPSYKNKNLIFEVYDPSTQQTVLAQLIQNTFITDPIGYYKNHILSKILRRQQEVQCMSKWYVKNCDENKNKMILMKADDEYIGYISMFQKNSNLVDTPIAGVLPKFQGRKMFDDLRTYRHLYCIENGIQYGTAGARIENNYSQQTFINDGMKQISNEAIYIVTPFFNKDADGIVIKHKDSLTDKDLFQSLKQLGVHFLKDAKIGAYSKRSLWIKDGIIANCKVSIPVDVDDKKLVVVQYFDAEEKLCLINWLEN